MFNLNKVNKARKRLEIITNVLFKLFQINLRYKEKRNDYGGWFTDGVTKLGNELKNDKKYFVVPNHIGQLLIFKIN